MPLMVPTLYVCGRTLAIFLCAANITLDLISQSELLIPHYRKKPCSKKRYLPDILAGNYTSSFAI